MAGRSRRETCGPAGPSCDQERGPAARRLLRVGCSAALALCFSASPGWAGGGQGGDGAVGGRDGVTDYGGNGVDSLLGGGGGGGGGYYGGTGGATFGCQDRTCLESGGELNPARGGAGGGRLGNVDGGDGESGPVAGGGGGGGAHGFVDPLAAPLPTTPTTGGNGGHGGSGGRAGGGGGGAGDGALLYDTDYTLTVDLVGGKGGRGGNGGDYGGMAGSGGHGLTLNRTGADIVIMSTVTGGNGGDGGSGATRGGNAGAAGSGVVQRGAYGGTIVVKGVVVGGNGGAGGGNGGWDSSGGLGIAAGVASTVVVESTVRGGNGGGSAGGGAAIYGGDLTVALRSTAVVEGGLSGDGSSRAASLVMSGRLNIDAGARLAGDIYADGMLSINPSTSFTLDQAIRGSGAIAKTGDGTLILSAANSFDGSTLIREGTLALSGAGSIANSQSVEIDGILDISATVSGASIREIFGEDGGSTGEIRLGAKTLTVVQNLDFQLNGTVFGTFGGEITGSGRLIKQGTATLTLAGNNTYSGATRIEEGALALAGIGSIANSSNVTVNAALDISGLSSNGTTIGTLDGSVAGTINLGAKTLTVGQRGDATFRGQIVGSGALFKSGGGTLTLTGASTYSGGTTIQAGKIAVESDTALGRGAVSIQDGGVLEFASDGISLGNAIRLSGSAAIAVGAGRTGRAGGAADEGATPGSLVKVGSGLLILTAQGSYTGGTAVNEGTLALAGAASIGASGSVSVNATLDISGLSAAGANIASLSGASTGIVRLGARNLSVRQDMDGTFAGAVTGTGSLVKLGAGRLTLSGVSDYSGGTRIDAGTISVATSAALGSGAIAMGGGATLDFARANLSLANRLMLSGVATVNVGVDQVTLAGKIDDGAERGALVKTGSGTLILKGKSAHSGGTAIMEGRLVGDSESLTGDILNNAAMTFDQATDGTFSGTVSGSGSLTKTGVGALVLTGNHSYAGKTVVEAGTLQIGDGGSSGNIEGEVVNDATLIFDRAGTYALPRQISGSGSLVVRGGGTAVFSGNGLGGATTVAGAALVLSPGSRFSTEMVVDAGGILGGTGTVGSLSVMNGGTASPGHSPGTLAVSGDVAFATGSTYLVEAAAIGEHDLMTVGGKAALSGGAVRVLAGGGKYAPTTVYTILSARGGVTGAFASVTTNLAFLDPYLSYDDDNVYLTLKRNKWAFEDVVFPPHQKAVADTAESLGLGNPVYDGILQLTAAQAPTAFEALSGAVHASASRVMMQHSDHLREAVTQRVQQGFGGRASTGIGISAAQAGPASNAVFWSRGYGVSLAEGSGPGRVSSTGGGVFGGLDVTPGDNYRLGAVAGYGRSTFEVGALGSTGSFDSIDLGFYGGARLGRFDFLGGGAYSWHGVSTGRTIAFPGFLERASADYRASAIQAFGEISYRIPLAASWGNAVLEPFVGMAYADLNREEFVERGKSAALKAPAASVDAFSSTLGMRFSTRVELPGGGVVEPHLNAGWQHAFGDTSTAASLAFGSGSPLFSTPGVPLARDTALIGLGVDYAFNGAVSAGLSYRGRYAVDVTESTFWGALSIRF